MDIHNNGLSENRLSATDSWHHIPYKKRSFYHAIHHQPKNQKVRAMDMPRALLMQEDGGVYRVKLPARLLQDRDPKRSGKYDSPHGSWKSEKKNKRQWMKHKPAHRDTVKYPERIVEHRYISVTLEGRRQLW